MTKYCKRKAINKVIKKHYRKRKSILDGHDNEKDHKAHSWYWYEEHREEVWHKAQCEMRCIWRVEKLLNKYR